MASLRRSIVVSALFTLFGGPGVLLVLFPFWITGFAVPAGEPVWQRALAVLLIAVGLAPLLDSIVRFIRVGRGTLMPGVPTEHLVVSGLYRYVRNPMYVGVVTALVGESSLFSTRIMMLYAALVWVGLNLFICLYEEPTLRKRYGDEYVRYCGRVRRWWPRVSAYESGLQRWESDDH